jgi:hypothetical protein
MPPLKKSIPSLKGTWRSDRTRTLAYWAFPPRTPARTKALIRGSTLFGHLIWRITPTRIHYKYKEVSGSSPYRIIWRNEYRVVLRLGRGSHSTIRDIHFDGPDRFYILSGKANCEFFRRMEANQRLERP